MVKIRILGRVEATIDGYRWECDDAVFLKALNLMLSPYGPAGSDPNPDYTAARKAIERFGGEILHVDEISYEGEDPNAIY